MTVGATFSLPILTFGVAEGTGFAVGGGLFELLFGSVVDPLGGRAT